MEEVERDAVVDMDLVFAGDSLFGFVDDVEVDVDVDEAFGAASWNMERNWDDVLRVRTEEVFLLSEFAVAVVRGDVEVDDVDAVAELVAFEVMGEVCASRSGWV